MRPSGTAPLATSPRDAESPRTSSVSEAVNTEDWTHLDDADPPVNPGFDVSAYDEAFLAAEHEMQRQLADGDPPPPALAPDDLRSMADAILTQAQGPDVPV